MKLLHRGRGVSLCLLAVTISLWFLVGAARATPVNSGLPTVSGTPQQGQTLTASPGTWTGTGTITYAYQWQSCNPTCTNVGTDSPTYVVAPSDVGGTIDVIVTASDSIPPSASGATSAQTATVTPSPPVNSTAPKISGTPQQGQTLTANAGIWTNTPTSYSYTWESCSGASCTTIQTTAASTLTTDTYVVAAADLGKTIDVSVVASNAGGAGTAANSAPTAAVTALAPLEATAPTITGTAQQGQTLTGSAGTWTNSPTSYTYQWQSCTDITCSTVKTTTASALTTDTYAVAAADVGKTIVLLVTAANSGGSGAAVSSLPTATVIPPAPNATSVPTISGNPQQGGVLSEQNGIWANRPTSFTYQWLECDSAGAGCAPIPGATSQSYGLTAADVGHTIIVAETASNGGSPVTAISARTAVITATSVTSLVISATGPATNQTVMLVATVSSSSGNAAPSGSITFFDGSRAIRGCANQSVQAGSQTISIVCHDSFAAGTASLTAVYTQGSGSLVQSSASARTTLNITRGSTSISLAVTKKVVRNKHATYRASVVLPVSDSGPIEPTGSIEFLDGGRPIRGCLSQALNQLAATCVVTYKALGKHKISARFNGDTNFAGSSSPVVTVQSVVRSPGATVLGYIGSTLEWTFHYHPTYTQVTALRIFGVAKGMTVTLTCHGGGCPVSRVSLPTGASSSMNVSPIFHGRRLRAGSQVTLRITRPHWIGKYFSFTVRPGQGPMIVLSCLGVGKARPGVGC